MSERPEIEDQVDLDDDNYSEDIDDDLEDQSEYEAAEDQSECEAAEKGGNDRDKDQPDDDIRSDDNEKEQSPQGDKRQIDGDEVEKSEDDKPKVQINEDEKEEYTQLLSLPPRGSEVFIGGISRDVLEEDLRDLCEPFGEIFEVKLVKNKDTGESKGFAFVAFRTKEVAQQAIEDLHNKNFKGRTIRCSLSDTKYRLFIGNIPKSWTDDEFKKVIEETGPGAENIELMKDPQNTSHNRGFAFVEYYNNACADYSRQKMSSDSFKLDGNSPSVSWADPKNTPDHSAAASQVKALYVKNIPENTPLEDLKKLFQRHGDVTKVVMPPGKSGGKRNFGFVHYAERSSALKAVKDTEKFEIDGQVLEVCLAKPQSDKKLDVSNPYSSGGQQIYMPRPGFGGLIANPYAPTPPLGAGFGATAGFQQPMIYGRGPTPTGMQMVPVVLPDGRIGYVLQQPGSQVMTQPPPPHHHGRRHDRSNDEKHGRGGSSGGYDDDNRSKRHRHY